jgi:hypothetical protein
MSPHSHITSEHGLGTERQQNCFHCTSNLKKGLNIEPQAADKIAGANSAGPFTPLPAIAGYAGELRESSRSS